ncbi:MAG: hypothetical protein AABM67_06845 [Acidobacteriota bacterium]
MTSIFKLVRHIVKGKIVFAALFSVLALRAIALGQDVTVSGTVVDQTTGAAIPTAKVRVYDNAGHPIKGPEPVGLNGEFRLILSSYQGGAVRCEISETNYLKRRITLPISGGRANAGTVRMVANPAIQLSSLTFSRSANGQAQFLDIIATNEAANSLTVSSVRLVGSARKHTECADTTPGVIFEITDTGEASGHSTAVINAPGKSFTDNIAINGRLTVLGCGQIRMDFQIPWKVSISPHESLKLRVTLPRQMKQRTGGEKKLLELEKWEALTLRVQLENGRTIESGLAH